MSNFPLLSSSSWVTVVWSMVAAACLTLAAIHGLVWWRQRTARANLLFAVTAVATTLLAAGELWMMRAETAEQFARAVRWSHVPAWLLIIALTGFVRLYLKAGRGWLAWTVSGLRSLALFLDLRVHLLAGLYNHDFNAKSFLLP